MSDMPVQLVDGASGHEGRVKVNISGQFNDVCAEDITLTAAQVMCGMLGFSSG